MNASLLPRPLRLGLVALALTAIVGAGVLLVRRSASTEPPTAPGAQPVPVQVAPARTGPIRTALTYSGAIEASQQVSLAPRLAGQLASVSAGVGTAVKAGDALATLDPGTLPAQLLQALATLQSAQARLDLMLAGPRSADVTAAEAALAAAEAKLRQLLNPTAPDLSAAEAAVTAAQTALDNAKVTVNSTRNSLVSAVTLYCNTFNAVTVKCDTPLPIPQPDLDHIQLMLRSSVTFALTDAGTRAISMTTANAAYLTAINNVANLELALSAAQDRYGQLRVPSASDIAAQRSLVETARAAVDNRRLPYTDADIAGARASVATAEAAVVAARTSLAQTSVVAPFDGVVAQRLLNVGATVSPQTPIFVLVAKAVESHLTVDEARIGLIRPGMEAEVVVPAFPNRVFKGTVATIAPLGDARAHTFDVKVYAEDAEGLLRPGMFAQVSVIAATKPNAVLVPTSAVVQQGATSRVFVIVDGKASAKQVKTGLADATSTEIVEGVAAGDQVVTVGQNVLRDGQAVAVATPGAGGGRPSGTPGAASTPGASPQARPSGTRTP